MRQNKIILTDVEPGLSPDSEELSNVIVYRIGLMPRKTGSTEKINQILIQLYERMKTSTREKNPAQAVMTVEEMAILAGITRQTMYDYLKRWLNLNFIIKTSYIDQNSKVVIGYKLNGNTLETAFEKARQRINNNLDFTAKYLTELQRVIKNEKISMAQKRAPEAESSDSKED
ncbi:MAG: hypothetical protein ABIC95_03545 [archaeon]